jgi:hypothetical protein
LKIPVGFQLSPGFHGVEAPGKHAQIRVKELRGQSFKQNGGQFTEAMLAPGQKLIEKREINIGDLQGRMLKFSFSIPSLVPAQHEQMICNMLALGDDKHFALLVASYPSFREKELGKEIENCLLNLTFDPANHLKMSMHALASFEINCQPLGLELAETKSLVKREGNAISLIFTENGKPSTGLESQHRLLVVENHWNSDPRSWPGQVIFQDNFFTRFEALEAGEVSIDDMPGLETWAIEQSKQTPDAQKLAYHVVLFDEGRHFEIRGYAPDDEIYRLTAFREVSNSFRRR